jgi:hypothetical protein
MLLGMPHSTLVRFVPINIFYVFNIVGFPNLPLIELIFLRSCFFTKSTFIEQYAKYCPEICNLRQINIFKLCPILFVYVKCVHKMKFGKMSVSDRLSLFMYSSTLLQYDFTDHNIFFMNHAYELF